MLPGSDVVVSCRGMDLPGGLFIVHSVARVVEGFSYFPCKDSFLSLLSLLSYAFFHSTPNTHQRLDFNLARIVWSSYTSYNKKCTTSYHTESDILQLKYKGQVYLSTEKAQRANVRYMQIHYAFLFAIRLLANLNSKFKNVKITTDKRKF